MRKSLLTFAALAVAATALAGATAHATGSGPEICDFPLPNGLEVVVIPDHRAPVVTHMVWYRVGSADETPGKSGLAHFLEHLMFKGTAKNPAGRCRVPSSREVASPPEPRSMAPRPPKSRDGP